MYQQLLYPRIDDIDKYLALLQSAPNAKRMQLRFAPAWKARRSELEVLADRAQKKHDDAKRIGVIHDTTSFIGVRIPRTAVLQTLLQSTSSKSECGKCSYSKQFCTR